MSLLKQYKDKLSGVSPDEAKALINNLEQPLTNLKDKVEPRHLTEEQRRLIIENATLQKVRHIEFQSKMSWGVTLPNMRVILTMPFDRRRDGKSAGAHFLRCRRLPLPLMAF